MIVRKKQSYTAEQYLPPLSIPTCVNSFQSDEGYFFGSLASSEGILPTEWVVRDEAGECLIYTDEDFQKLFEEVITTG